MYIDKIIHICHSGKASIEKTLLRTCPQSSDPPHVYMCGIYFRRKRKLRFFPPGSSGDIQINENIFVYFRNKHRNVTININKNQYRRYIHIKRNVNIAQTIPRTSLYFCETDGQTLLVIYREVSLKKRHFPAIQNYSIRTVFCKTLEDITL